MQITTYFLWKKNWCRSGTIFYTHGVDSVIVVTEKERESEEEESKENIDRWNGWEGIGDEYVSWIWMQAGGEY